MPHLYLIRHGTPENTAGRCVGQYEVDLSAEGHEEIRRLAAEFINPPKRIITSDLARARQSAGIFASIWNIPPLIDARLREISFGEWEGRSWDDITSNDGDAFVKWEANWTAVAPPQGESMLDIARRAAAWIASEEVHGYEGDAVVFTHAGFIRCLICTLRGISFASAFDIKVAYGRVAAILDVSSNGVTVSVPCTPHPATLFP